MLGAGVFLRGCNRWLTYFKPQLVVVNWKICYDKTTGTCPKIDPHPPHCG